MTVDLNVLEHLGINLYSNIAAVLTEAVANAWDADAEIVKITVDLENNTIVIEDDGIGMSAQDLNDKYLRVGYRRREEDAKFGRVTAKNRPVMGRKGLGKLSLFSIADIIEVQSAKDGTTNGFRMSTDEIRRAVRERVAYHPTPLPQDAVDVTKGTKLVLQSIKRQRLGRGVTALRRRLARRFSVIGAAHGFAIEIDGVPVTALDRGDLPKTQFLWTFEGSKLDTDTITHVVEKEDLPSRSSDWPTSWRVSGWIGTARRPKDLDDDQAGNLNGIVVFSRGRLFQENILDELNDGRLYTKYVTGQIEADFLDLDDQPDIATSDRQRIQEDDPRYTKLLEFLRTRLNQVEKRWNKWRSEHEAKRAREASPALEQWFDGLRPGHRRSAQALIARLSALPVDREEDRKLLYKHGIFAFERMKLRGSTEELTAGIDHVERLLALMGDRDALEASLYRDIVKSRIEAIQQLQQLVDADAKERALQEYLFDHMWLLDPSWERAAGSEIMESRLTEAGVIVPELTKKERLGRVDIKYRTMAGKHIIVELKKAGRQMKLLELQDQGITYADKLAKILVAQGESNPNIEVIFVLGRPVEEESSNPDRLKNSMAAISPGSRIVHYDELIRGAEEAYAAYLLQSRELDQLEGILSEL